LFVPQHARAHARTAVTHLDRERGEVLHLLGLRGGEERRLSLLGQQADDGVHLLLEALLQQAVRLVDDEHLQRVRVCVGRGNTGRGRDRRD